MSRDRRPHHRALLSSGGGGTEHNNKPPLSSSPPRSVWAAIQGSLHHIFMIIRAFCCVSGITKYQCGLTVLLLLAWWWGESLWKYHPRNIFAFFIYIQPFNCAVSAVFLLLKWFGSYLINAGGTNAPPVIIFSTWYPPPGPDQVKLSPNILMSLFMRNVMAKRLFWNVQFAFYFSFQYFFQLY